MFNLEKYLLTDKEQFRLMSFHDLVEISFTYKEAFKRSSFIRDYKLIDLEKQINTLKEENNKLQKELNILESKYNQLKNKKLTLKERLFGKILY